MYSMYSMYSVYYVLCVNLCERCTLSCAELRCAALICDIRHSLGVGENEVTRGVQLQNDVMGQIAGPKGEDDDAVGA